MDKRKLIIYNPVTNLYDFFINSLIIEFKKYNVDIIFYDPSLVGINKTDIILILINPHFIFDYNNIYNEINKISTNYKFKIIYLTEPINFLVEKKVYLDLINIIKPYCLWTYTTENFNKIRTYVPVYKIFPSYNEAYNFTKISLSNIINKNTNNIIFLGNINDNRKDVCNKFNDYLINTTDSWMKEDWSKILDNNLFYLNIHRRNNCKSFESFRIIPILANGGFIFSERTNEAEEKEYKDYNIIFVNKDDLYNTFLEFRKNINYTMIYEKALLYRNNMIENNGIEKFMNYHLLTLL